MILVVICILRIYLIFYFIVFDGNFIMLTSYFPFQNVFYGILNTCYVSGSSLFGRSLLPTPPWKNLLHGMLLQACKTNPAMSRPTKRAKDLN